MSRHFERGIKKAWVVLSLCLVNVNGFSNITRQLDDLEHAKSHADFQHVASEMGVVSTADRKELRNFAFDKRHEGRKRYLAFSLSQKGLTDIEKQTEVIDVLRHESDRDFKIAALFDLKKSSSSLGITAFRNIANNNEEDICVRMAAIANLAHRQDFTAQQAAIDAVVNASPCEDVAIEALTQSPHQDIMALLQQRLNITENIEKRNSIRLALLRLQMAGKNTLQAEQLAGKAFYESLNYRAQQWAALYLGSVGDNQALSILKAAAKSGNTPGAAEAIMGLRIGIEKGHWTESDVQQ